MFDLIAGGPRHPFHKPTIVPTVVSIVGHGFVLLTVAGASFAVATDQLPAIPDMMAFVTAAPAPAPPPPPPPPPARRAAAPAKTEPLPASRAAAPVEAPAAIVSETAIPAGEDEEGVEGGVEGGVAGGTLGGVIGGLLAAPLPPPPPPSPLPAPVAAAPRTPVRIGGQITAPALLYRVNPVYPEIAVHAKVTGTVILEATVDTEGRVESVRVLRSISVLNNAAIEAVKQWRYSPLVLNGIPTPFVLTVTLSFSLQHK
jgi:protein TonB